MCRTAARVEAAGPACATIEQAVVVDTAESQEARVQTLPAESRQHTPPHYLRRSLQEGNR